MQPVRTHVLVITLSRIQFYILEMISVEWTNQAPRCNYLLYVENIKLKKKTKLFIN